MAWRDPDGLTHLAGASVGTAAQLGLAGTVETLSGASPVWQSRGGTSPVAAHTPRVSPQEDRGTHLLMEPQTLCDAVCATLHGPHVSLRPAQSHGREKQTLSAWEKERGIFSCTAQFFSKIWSHVSGGFLPPPHQLQGRGARRRLSLYRKKIGSH